jgi:hypothetical protein
VGALASRIDASQEEMRKKTEVTINFIREESESAILSIRSDLYQTMKHRVQDVLACANQRTQDLCKEQEN